MCGDGVGSSSQHHPVRGGKRESEGPPFAALESLFGQGSQQMAAEWLDLTKSLHCDRFPPGRWRVSRKGRLFRICTKASPVPWAVAPVCQVPSRGPCPGALWQGRLMPWASGLASNMFLASRTPHCKHCLLPCLCFMSIYFTNAYEYVLKLHRVNDSDIRL